jgi:AcrR family transcriptional regulator
MSARALDALQPRRRPPSPAPTGQHLAAVSGTDTRAEGDTRARGRPRNELVSRAITDAALRQLQEVGFARLSMESVACEAGVARATVYRRYRDKADLVTAAIAANGAVELPEGPSEDPRGDLARFLQEFDARFAESCFEVVGSLMAAREAPHAMAMHRDRVVFPRTAYARRLLEQARQEGQLDRDADLDLALQMLSGSVFARRVAGLPTEPGWAERAVGAIWDGMGGPGRARRASGPGGGASRRE